ncbi:hypothetical protein VFPPC_17027 [Pochonia chlamydosporia 170]|uniref:Uncharacterized protein n=1 Tax=Pochonia chlamydosporia 170 TaxID=1380566 RepID=A0A179EZ23_METCM|nr:hypothetical protein VFPPC_17027 [Pochonia chlamydosporia 170]OAQ58149.1 hypothetical protein VFPPC_17027 [Pochonia chlamydosporia 170]
MILRDDSVACGPTYDRRPTVLTASPFYLNPFFSAPSLYLLGRLAPSNGYGQMGSSSMAAEESGLVDRLQNSERTGQSTKNRSKGLRKVLSRESRDKNRRDEMIRRQIVGLWV